MGSAVLAGVLCMFATYAQVAGFGGADALARSTDPMDELAELSRLGFLGFFLHAGFAASFRKSPNVRERSRTTWTDPVASRPPSPDAPPLRSSRQGGASPLGPTLGPRAQVTWLAHPYAHVDP
ncbi:hypothetical protein ACWD4K_19480 [Streptomyces gelaticus]